MNPLTVIYFSFRVVTRFVLGRQHRNSILRKLHWETLSEFLDWTRFPGYLSELCMVEEVEARIKRKYFRHEPEVSSLLATLHGQLFIDVGANVGYYSFLLHDNFDRIIAVEPHPNNVRLMRRVKEKYGYPKVNLLPKAISNKDGESKLYLGSHRGGHSLVKKPTSDCITIGATTLDFLLRTHRNVDLVKVDVEGAEWKVLDGAGNVMNKIKSWMIELHDKTHKSELENLLKSYGYKMKWVDFDHIYAWRQSSNG